MMDTAKNLLVKEISVATKAEETKVNRTFNGILPFNSHEPLQDEQTIPAAA
jgi:RNA polymerase-interacting CarD/CdnL/TRCF family regulator